MNKELEKQIHSALRYDDSLETFLEILLVFKRGGGGQEEALVTLENMREFYQEFEDQILEIMDFVTGFCRPEFRIW